MAKKGNSLTLHVQEVHHALSRANFLAFRAHSSAERDKSIIQKAIDAGKRNFRSTSSFITGQDIYITDQRELVAYSGTMVKDDDQIKLIDEADGIAQADAIVTAYEAMEHFVKKLTAEYWYVKRNDIPVENELKQKTSRRFGKEIERENTKPWFDQLVQVAAIHNTRTLFDKFLFKWVVGLQDRVTNFVTGDLRVDLCVVHRVVEAIRHCKTHANGRYDPTKFAYLSHDVQNRVKQCTRISFLNSMEEWILPSHKQAKELIAREAEYAQILYDTFTRDLDMKLEWTPGRDPKTSPIRKIPN